MVDVGSIPHWLENAVRKSKREEILYDFPAEKMIDAIDVVLIEAGVDPGIESARGCEVAPERLLDDETRPAADSWPEGFTSYSATMQDRRAANSVHAPSSPSAGSRITAMRRDQAFRFERDGGLAAARASSPLTTCSWFNHATSDTPPMALPMKVGNAYPPRYAPHEVSPVTTA